MSRTVAAVSVAELNLQSLHRERRTGLGDTMLPKVGQKTGIPTSLFLHTKIKPSVI